MSRAWLGSYGTSACLDRSTSCSFSSSTFSELDRQTTQYNSKPLSDHYDLFFLPVTTGLHPETQTSLSGTGQVKATEKLTRICSSPYNEQFRYTFSEGVQYFAFPSRITAKKTKDSAPPLVVILKLMTTLVNGDWWWLKGCTSCSAPKQTMSHEVVIKAPTE